MGTNRERAAVPEPQEIITGPKIALMNHWSASDGDIFPYLFKLYGIGKLLGTRTWGGVRGIRGEWRMLDGGYVTIPEDAMYGTDSVWSLENHGNDPDIELENEPADLLAGHDAQLEKATQLMVEAIGTKPAGLPPPPPLLPAYPPNGIVPPQP
jgi:tricorn protease